MNNKLNHNMETLNTARAHNPTTSELTDTFTKFIIKKYDEYGENVSNQTAGHIAIMIIADSGCTLNSSSLVNLFTCILVKSESDLKSFLLHKLMIIKQKVGAMNE